MTTTNATPTLAVRELLTGRPEGLKLQDLIARLEDQNLDPQAVCDGLEQVAQDCQVKLAHDPAGDPRNELLFKPAMPYPFVADIESVAGQELLDLEAVQAAANAIVRYLASLTDQRGDDSPIAPPSELFRKLAPQHSVEVLEKAFEVAFAEGLLYLMARPTNGYVTVTLSRTRGYTIFSHDGQTFHVRAGAEALANLKFDAAYPQLRRLALLPGFLTPRSPDGLTYLTPRAL